MNKSARISERDQIAALQEEIHWLRGELGLLLTEEQIFEAQRAFQLTRSEARLLLALVNAKLLTKDMAMSHLAEAGYEYDADDKIVDVWVCKLRAKLKPCSLSIETAWGTGHFLGQQSRRRLAEWLGQQPYGVSQHNTFLQVSI